jgi:hypothetical protein
MVAEPLGAFAATETVARICESEALMIEQPLPG